MSGTRTTWRKGSDGRLEQVTITTTWEPRAIEEQIADDLLAIARKGMHDALEAERKTDALGIGNDERWGRFVEDLTLRLRVVVSDD